MHACAPFSYQVDFCIFIPIDKNTSLIVNPSVHSLLELSACNSSISARESGEGSQLAKHQQHELGRAAQDAPAAAPTNELEELALAQRK